MIGLLILSICVFTFAQRPGMIHVENSKGSERSDFMLEAAAHPDLQHEVVFAISQRNIDILEKTLYEVSDPVSPKYGKYLTRKEIADLTANAESTLKITNHLRVKGAVITSSTIYGEYITAKAKISLWEELFDAKFYKYKHVTDGSAILRANAYSLHEDIIKDISTVFHIIDFPFPKKSLNNAKRFKKDQSASTKIVSTKTKTTTSTNSTQHRRLDFKDRIVGIAGYAQWSGYVVPSLLKSLYNVEAKYGSTSLGSQCIYASLGQSFSPADLVQFQNQFNLPSYPVKNVINGHSNDTACIVNSNNCNEANLDVQYMQAVSGKIPTTYWYDATGNFITWLTTVANTKSPPLVQSISYGVAESYLTASFVSQFNTEAMKQGAMGVTLLAASGDDGAPSYTVASNNKCLYNPSFPASSPYVTAVGATQGPENYQNEIACQSNTGGGITTGGGFSNLMSAPSFQTKAMKGYINTASTGTTSTGTSTAPVSGYNAAGRGFPDISVLGYNYVVVIGGQLYILSGTSASTPVVAGMVALVNSLRLSSGKSSIGWLNPSIYAVNGSFTNDVISGHNKCTRDPNICCSQGFYATPGWDPVTGFGSVDYGKFCAQFYGGPECGYTSDSDSIVKSSFLFITLLIICLLLF